MPNLFAYDYARAYQDELAREAQQERLANRARSRNDGAWTVDRSARNGARHSPSTAASDGNGSSTTIDPDPIDIRRPQHGRRGRSLVSWRMR
jgi:hypothetical protein